MSPKVKKDWSFKAFCSWISKSFPGIMCKWKKRGKKERKKKEKGKEAKKGEKEREGKRRKEEKKKRKRY